MMKKIIKISALIIFFVGILHLILEYDPFDLLYYLRKKTEFETRFSGCAIGVSNKENLVQKRYPITNIFYLFEDPFPLEILKTSGENSILMITWEPFDKKNKRRNILPDIISGVYDKHIQDFATQAKSFGKPLIVRFGHEMNGNWYPWSGMNNGTSPDNYIAAFRRIRSFFKQQGVGNVIFAFAVNNEDIPAEPWNRFENYYPGADYVDLVVVDAYNWGTHPVSPKRLLMKSYERLIKNFPSKPLMIGEIGTGSLHVDKAIWIKELFGLLEHRFSAIKGLIWFDVIKEEDWGFSHDPSLEKIFLEKMETDYYKNGYNNLKWMFTNEKKSTFKKAR